MAGGERGWPPRLYGERELLDQLGLAGDDDARITLVADERWMRLVTRLQCLLRERLGTPIGADAADRIRSGAPFVFR